MLENQCKDNLFNKRKTRKHHKFVDEPGIHSTKILPLRVSKLYDTKFFTSYGFSNIKFALSKTRRQNSTGVFNDKLYIVS
uniref:Uncharacterized protein n=1 Tax=Romanomermis culicivorax TaxID=13658 RepID=A0A915IZW8_ROMCU